MSEQNAVKIMQLLQDFGFGSVGLQASDFLNPQAVIQLGYEPNRIDLLTNLDGVDFQTAKPQAVQATFAGRTISVISKHHLIINKRTVSRPRCRRRRRASQVFGPLNHRPPNWPKSNNATPWLQGCNRNR
jgi:hypothetical protein